MTNATHVEKQSASVLSRHLTSVVCSDSESTVAWMMILPIVVVLLIGIFGVVPLLVHEPNIQVAHSHFLPGFYKWCKPEPLEHARWLWTIAIVPALWAVSLFSQGRVTQWVGSSEIRSRVATVCAQLVQVALTSFLIGNLACDESRLSSFWFPGLIAALIISLMVFGRKRIVKGLASLGLSTGQNAFFSLFVPLGLAAAYTALRVLPGLVRDVTYWSPGAEVHLPYSSGELSAVLNGRTLLVDFYPQYQNFSEYALSPFFSLIKMTPLSFSLVMVTLTIIVLASVLRLFHQCTQNWWATLLFYLPFCTAATFPMMRDYPTFNTVNYFAAMPLRYFGPFMVAMLCMHYLRKPSTNRQFVLFFVGAVAAMNNLDFGVPALGAALATIIFSSSHRLIPDWKRVLQTLALFVLCCSLAVGLHSLITFLRSHQMPDIARSFQFQRIWVLNGMGMLPIPNSGIHWNVFLTFMAGLLWSLRSYSKNSNSQPSLINGLLFYSSVFGCGAMTYFVGRSHIAQLTVVFAAWAFTLALLTMSVWNVFIRNLGTFYPLSTLLKAGLVPFTVLLAPIFLFIGSAVASPSPSAELHRLVQNRNDDWNCLQVQNFIKKRIRSGEQVSIIHPYGFQLANNLGIRNHLPFTAPFSIVTKEQFRRVFTEFDTKGVKHVFLETVQTVEVENRPVWRHHLRKHGFHRKSRLVYSPNRYRVEHWEKSGE